MTCYRHLLFARLTMLLLIAGCVSCEDGPGQTPGSGGEKARLTIFAAASLTGAFTAIAQAFEEAHAGVEVALNLAGSQQLAQQLRLGAPADVFASANELQMQAAIKAGRVAPDAPQPFAGNQLVVVVPGNNPAGLTQLQDLAQPGLRLVFAADEVPVGRYSRRFLEKASLDEAFGAAYGQQVLAGVASFEQNVRAVLTKVMLGEADAGIVYTSDLVGVDEVLRIIIPENLNALAVYPIAQVIDSAHPDLARIFVNFVRSPEGQEILLRYGFASANPS